jgi:hypothetical protein
MRYVLGFLCVCVLVGSLPLGVGAQDAEEGTSAEPSAEEPVPSPQPTRSRVERWHPEAFVDPTKPASEPALQLEIDSAGLEVTPTAPPIEEHKRKRRIAIGVSVSIAVVALVVGVGVGVSVSKIKREGVLGSSRAGIVF